MKRAYLTIDDAPSLDFTAKMEYLDQASPKNKCTACGRVLTTETRSSRSSPRPACLLRELRVSVVLGNLFLGDALHHIPALFFCGSWLYCT